ncbi:ABC transporter ATP-binding protein [Nesterenkonia alkaliphila]|uniref:ABC transporter ATP-binding protein n=1 Tax=Nesterenkonia alkaliphila TaxID=1463631 RepID=UPI0019C14C25|nr:ABC transporter ATP-binding protein [Nesterenkonia alkaliphila]GFZ80867.1 ABC transporter ATP-binding protein [Nesterenkonia alkaliphila]
MPASAPCLSLTGVRYALGSARSTSGVTEILSGVDLTARRGEVTVIIGPNGAGKTTTLGCAQGLIRPSAGTVRLLGQDPYRAGAELRARVGVMLQDGGLPQSVKPLTLLRHIAALHQRPWPLEDLIERLDLGGFLSTAVRRLSGGQKQRIAMAAALTGNPELVFLDEPSAGLDPQSRQLVFELIAELRSRGTGIVLTTHLLEEAQQLADSVYILKAGRVVRHGTVAELTGGAQGAARRLTFASPRILTTAELQAAPLPVALDNGANRSGSYWAVESIGSAADLQALSTWWAQIDLLPAEISFEARTLEDVFWEVSAP